MENLDTSPADSRIYCFAWILIITSMMVPSTCPSCLKICELDLANTSVVPPETIQFSSESGGFFQAGSLLGCVNDNVTLECAEGYIHYEKGNMNTTVTLSCSPDSKWTYKSSNGQTKEINYLLGCTKEPPCVFEGFNQGELKLSKQMGKVFFKQNLNESTFIVLAAEEGATASFVCPNENDFIFYYFTYAQEITLTCYQGQFDRRGSLPFCYTGAPYCQHLFYSDSTVQILPMLVNVVYGLMESPNKITACISQQVQFQCSSTDHTIWVQHKPRDPWRDLGVGMVTAKCGESVGPRDLFFLWIILGNTYFHLPFDPPDASNYTCKPPPTSSPHITSTLTTQTTTPVPFSSPTTTTISSLTAIPESPSTQTTTSDPYLTATSTQFPHTSMISTEVLSNTPVTEDSSSSTIRATQFFSSTILDESTSNSFTTIIPSTTQTIEIAEDSVVTDEMTSTLDLDQVTDAKGQTTTVTGMMKYVVSLGTSKDGLGASMKMNDAQENCDDFSAWTPPTEAERKVIEARRERSNKISSLMGQYLLKGYKMLATSCHHCNCILIENRQKQTYCIACNEVDTDTNKDNPAVSEDAARRTLEESLHRNATTEAEDDIAVATPSVHVGSATPLVVPCPPAPPSLTSKYERQLSSDSLKQQLSDTLCSPMGPPRPHPENGTLPPYSASGAPPPPEVGAATEALRQKLSWATRQLQASVGVQESQHLARLISEIAAALAAIRGLASSAHAY